MQLSEMEEEMDQRIHATERKTRDQVGPDLLPLPSPQSKKALHQDHKTEG